MDLLGNFMSVAGGLKINGSSETVSHAVNETNEITSISYTNPAPGRKIITDDFAASLASIWTADKGGWSTSSGVVNCDSLTTGDAHLLAEQEKNKKRCQEDFGHPEQDLQAMRIDDHSPAGGMQRR